MSDATESKVRQWAMKRNGAELQPGDIVELVLAVDDDAVARTADVVNRVDEVASCLESQDGRICNLETCVESLQKADEARRDVVRGVGRRVLDKVAIPLVVVVMTLILTRVFSG